MCSVSSAHAQIGYPTSINNDDSCDIGQFPAATLLVPYFEVDITSARWADTLLSVVNTGRHPQIVNATVWTDWGYPVLTFDVWLGGYDVYSLSIYDLLAGGRLPVRRSRPAQGARSIETNPGFAEDADLRCSELAESIEPELLEDVQSALTTGVTGGVPRRVGNPHDYPRGYITLDVVSTCSDTLPDDARYFSEILYDNVLTGDVILTRREELGDPYAAYPMVHIRAIPEGGPAGQAAPSSLPFTFYDLYTPDSARKLDRRQPLPSLFASRYLSGPQLISTDFLVWREPRTGRRPADYTRNANMTFTEIVRFDERENTMLYYPSCQILCTGIPDPTLPVSSRVSVDDPSVIPPDFSGTSDLGGWLYMNLSNGGSAEYSRSRQEGSPRAGVSQNWVQPILSAAPHQMPLPVTQLGNGCSPAPGVTTPNETGEPVIGPAPNVNP